MIIYHHFAWINVYDIKSLFESFDDAESIDTLQKPNQFIITFIGNVFLQMW